MTVVLTFQDHDLGHVLHDGVGANIGVFGTEMTKADAARTQHGHVTNKSRNDIIFRVNSD